jgi:hypothetical protein
MRFFVTAAAVLAIAVAVSFPEQTKACDSVLSVRSVRTKSVVVQQQVIQQVPVVQSYVVQQAVPVYQQTYVQQAAPVVETLSYSPLQTFSVLSAAPSSSVSVQSINSGGGKVRVRSSARGTRVRVRD